MSHHPVTHKPELTNSIFTLLPNEYIRLEYNYNPGCCCFSSKTTTVTNMRLITRVIKTRICSKKTSTGKIKDKVIFLKDINNIKQIQSAIPSSQNKWWMKFIDILTCTCSNQEIDWIEPLHGIENLGMNTDESTTKNNTIEELSLIEKF